MRSPRVFSIPTGTPFLPTLAEALLDGTLTGGWPDGTGLADATIYLPTRRAGRAFAAHLADLSGRRALLLPRIVPLGDLDEDAFEPVSDALPPVPMTERRLILARLVQGWAAALDRAGTRVAAPDSAADAIGLASDLAALMDSLATEEVDWDALGSVVATDHSEYFASTLSFVRIAHELWPTVLAERKASDPAHRRHAALLAEAERIAANPPRGPIVAAGSTGSIPATARLLAAIARLPHGSLVLPGLDTMLDEPAWLSIGGRAGADRPEHGPLWSHPQCMMQRFLADPLGIDRTGVHSLGPRLDDGHPVTARRAMLSEVMRPAESTDSWALSPDRRDTIATAGCRDLVLIEAGDEREEALAIAIALRETLEEPGRMAALVTPDRALATRVAIELRRWGIEAEDSAGSVLAETPGGRLARLAAEVAASDFAPLSLLALLAHPAVTLGLPREKIAAAAAALEIGVLRGPAPGPGLAGIAAALELRKAGRSRHDPLPRQNLTDLDWDAAGDLLARLDDAFSGFAREAPEEVSGDVREDLRDARQPLPPLAAPHAKTLLALLAGGETENADRSLAAILDLLGELTLMPEDAGILGRFDEYPAFLTTLARERVLAPDISGGHRRIRILGLLEARLLEVDRIVLGALDESIWPPIAESDAFLSRPMRLALGLSPPERRIGQTAHDFVQALGVRDAFVTRARKRDAKPTVPSRFLERLRAYVGQNIWTELGARGRRYLALAEAIDRPRAAQPAPRPNPRPGAARFPRSLSVTEIETLVRDPYSIFARHILKLSPLDPVSMPPNFSERGTILHAVLAEFSRRYPGALPALARDMLLQVGLDAFEGLARAYPELHALWWPEFLRISPVLLDWEEGRRSLFANRIVEANGRLRIPLAKADDFVIRARADRIELNPDGGGAVIDFKSGRVPTGKVVRAGFSPQLTLEAAMLRDGGFADARATGAPELLYVKLGGRARLEPSQIEPDSGESLAELVERHVEGVTRLARRFAIDGEGYLSRPYPQYALEYSAYDHLARVDEWSLAEDEDGAS